jgi:hypothetical protein
VDIAELIIALLVSTGNTDRHCYSPLPLHRGLVPQVDIAEPIVVLFVAERPISNDIISDIREWRVAGIGMVRHVGIAELTTPCALANRREPCAND